MENNNLITLTKLLLGVEEKTTKIGEMELSDDIKNLFVDLDISSESTVLEAIEQLMIYSNDKYIRLYSEFENYKKRMRADIVSAIGDEKTKTMDGIFMLLDDINLARSINSSGVNNIDIDILMSKLDKFIENNGYTPIDNSYFNEELHEAISITNLPNYEDNQIVSVLAKGYTYNGKITKFSKVVVNKK